MDGNKVRSNDCHGMDHDGHCEGVVDRSVDEPKAVPFSRGECYFGVVSSGSTVGVDVGPVEQDVVTRGGEPGCPGTNGLLALITRSSRLSAELLYQSVMGRAPGAGAGAPGAGPAGGGG